MPINLIYDNEDDVPEAHKELYTETDGKWNLTGVTGMKTQGDIDRVQGSLAKERDDHKATSAKLKTFEGVDIEQHGKDQTELTELRLKMDAGGGGTFDQVKFDEAVDKLATARAATATAPLQTSLDTMTKERDTFSEENGALKTNETNRVISDAVRAASSEIKVIDTAVDDVLLLGKSIFEVAEDGQVVTRDNVGVTPGIAPGIWLNEMQTSRPHWWPVAQGGGAGGSGAAGGFDKNPWSFDHWNMTLQGREVVANRDKAERMAKAVGSTIGGQKPADPAAKK